MKPSSSSSSTTMRRSGGSASLLSRYMGVGRSERSGSSGALSVTDCLEAFAEDEPAARRGRVPLSAVRGAAARDQTALRAALAAGAGVASETVPRNDRGKPGRKIDTAVDVPQTLSLSPYLAEGAATANGGGEAKYELFAVINHAGSLAGGHYTATRGRGRGGVVRLQRRARLQRGGRTAQVLAQRVRVFYALRR